MNTLRSYWIALLGLIASVSVASAQDPAYVTEAQSAVTSLTGNINTLLPVLFALGLLIFAGPFVWRYVKRFMK